MLKIFKYINIGPTLQPNFYLFDIPQNLLHKIKTPKANKGVFISNINLVCMPKCKGRIIDLRDASHRHVLQLYHAK